jgi:hypothetical protein
VGRRRPLQHGGDIEVVGRERRDLRCQQGREPEKGDRDGVAVVSTVTVLVVVYLLVNLLVDLLYGVLDPRISQE